MTVVFCCLRNCSGCKDDDFRDEGREFQHVGPETAKAREPNVTVLVRGKFRSPWVASRKKQHVMCLEAGSLSLRRETPIPDSTPLPFCSNILLMLMLSTG